MRYILKFLGTFLVRTKPFTAMSFEMKLEKSFKKGGVVIAFPSFLVRLSIFL